MFIFIIFYYYPTNVQILFHINYKTQQKDIKKHRPGKTDALTHLSKKQTLLLLMYSKLSQVKYNLF